MVCYMNITFRQVDAFRTVVSTGSVTEAASVLGISQPAVSRLLTDMEKEVGFKLFSRVGRNLVPTAESRLLGEEVKRALSGLERIKDAARSIRSFKNAQLRVVTTPTFSSLLSTFCLAKAVVSSPLDSSDPALRDKTCHISCMLFVSRKVS